MQAASSPHARAMTRGPLSPPQSPNVDHQAAVLHDVDSFTRQSLGSHVVADAKLEPDRLRSFREYVVDVRRDVLGTTEHVDEIDLTRNLRKRAEDALCEDRRDV